MRQNTKEKLSRLAFLVSAGRMDEAEALIASEWARRHIAKNALAEIGIELPRKRTEKRALKKSTLWDVLRELVKKDGRSQSEIARQVGCTRQYVELIRRQAERAGVLASVNVEM